MIIAPAALVVLAEHIGHLVVTGNIVDRDLIKDPGLSRSLFADGLSNVISGFAGATPNTTYGENIGVMAITKVYSTWVIGGAAVMAIILSFCGKLSELIHSIPVPVMGGICILLFGVIAASGIRVLVERRRLQQILQPRNDLCYYDYRPFRCEALLRCLFRTGHGAGNRCCYYYEPYLQAL